MEVVNQTFEVDCAECKSTLRYDNDDIETTWIGGSSFIRCPVCGRKIFLEYAQIKKVE